MVATRRPESKKPNLVSWAKYLFFSGGGSRIRTCDLLIKSQLLYQLSYTPKTNPAGLWGTKHNNALATTCNAGIVRQTRQTVSTVLGN
jgi:hypothetical protein